MASNWAFIRSVPTFGSAPTDMPDFRAMQQAGWAPLFAYNDPRLDLAIRAAQQAGIQYGIWGDPGQMDPVSFARTMAGLARQYNPSVVVPDIEFIGKGYQGSPGWEYNERLASEWARLLPNVPTAVTVMPNQEDFNYEAWGRLQNVSWLPQAYGADPTKHVFDPQQVIDTLVRRGVDPSKVVPVLGPGHRPGYSGQYALWTVDDWIGKELPRANAGAASVRRQGSPVSDAAAMPSRVPDAQNPRAVEYATRRLRQLRNLGVLQEMPAGDPTAAWRQASQNIAQIARERGFQNPRDFLRAGSAPPDRRVVQLATAMVRSTQRRPNRPMRAQ